MLGLKTFFISPHDGDYFHNYNNIVSDLTLLCFNVVCNEETMVFPKRRKKEGMNVEGGIYQVFEISAVPGVHLSAFPVDLIASSSKQVAVWFQPEAEPMVTNES